LEEMKKIILKEIWKNYWQINPNVL
jgi:hypothetical protein